MNHKESQYMFGVGRAAHEDLIDVFLSQHLHFQHNKQIQGAVY